MDRDSTGAAEDVEEWSVVCKDSEPASPEVFVEFLHRKYDVETLLLELQITLIRWG